MIDHGKRDLVSIEDLSTAEILELFHHADEFRANLTAWTDLCRGTIMATLFFDPSTRTRLSFESAMLRLGAGVITAADEKNTSRSKGESLADTVRVVGGSYADILVVRHPEDGAARVAARYARVPVINGGDGAHEHPTQTLCDLYTLWKEKGRSRPAQTQYATITGYDDYTLLRCELFTGRTHQIRVHLAYIGFPIVGDKVYGRRKPTIPLGRHFLHASVLTVKRPSVNEELTLHAELPTELEATLDKLAQVVS